MKFSQGYFYTLKEDPADAEIPSHKLLVRGGYIRKVGQGIYSYGPLILRSLRKFEAIVREELNKRNCIEISMPMVHPGELWKETGRWEAMGKGLLKFKNRLDQDFCLGATHEEVVTDFVRRDLKSYRDLPKNLYQIQTKYRDEIRPRFGLMRGREFIMKDAYSFDASREDAEKSYDHMFEAYSAIFSRLGAEFRYVDADPGDIGGDKSQEFHILASSGEDHLMVSTEGEFAANIEVCPAIDSEPALESNAALEDMEEFATPGLRTISDLAKTTGLGENELVKTMFYASSLDPKDIKPICVLLRGSDEVNPIKVKMLAGLSHTPELLNDHEVKALTSASPGSCGPVGLKIPIYMDNGVAGLKNYIVGANKDDAHLKNVNHERDYKVTKVGDLRMAKEGDKSPDGKGQLKSIRGVEVGHIFYLGTKYSKAMNASFLDSNGKAKPIEMGCYGIGISRTVQAVVEQNHDKDGIIWPKAIAPYHVHICLLDPKDEECSSLAEKLYASLGERGIEVLMDDREERPGIKFKDADLLGMPLRVVIGARGLKNGEIELVVRRTKEQTKVAPDNLLTEIEKTLDGL